MDGEHWDSALKHSPATPLEDREYKNCNASTFLLVESLKCAKGLYSGFGLSAV